MEHIFLASEADIKEFIRTLEFSEHEQLWDNVRTEIKENLSVILESFQNNSPCKPSDCTSNEKKDNEEATERMHYLVDIVNFSYQYLQHSTLQPRNMLEAMIYLHDSLLFLPNDIEKIKQLKQIICKICIFCWVNDLSGAENLVTQSIPYLLMSSLQDDNHESNIKNLFSIREALYLFDFDDSSSEFLRELLLRCVICPRYLKNIDGRRFLSFLFSVDAGLHSFLMDTIKPQLALGNKSVSKAYGDILQRAWKELEEKNDKQKTFKDLIEDLIQELIHCAIHAEHQKYFIGLRSALSAFHEAKRLKDIDKLLFRAYGPILWRSLQCANPAVRAQASALFFDAFPLQNPDANTVDTDTNLQKQYYFFHVLLNDEDHRVRAVAAAGVCHVLKGFWEIIPLQDIENTLRFIALNLCFDSSWAAVRINAVKGLTSLLENPLTHLQLKIFLPALRAVMYDKSEAVCVSFLQLLCKISCMTDLQFIDLAPLQEIHSLLALKAHRPPIASRIVELLLPSYYPEKSPSDVHHDLITASSTSAAGKSSSSSSSGRSSASEQLRRCVEFVKQNEAAAVVFYGMFYQHSSVGRATKLAVMILSVLRKDAEILGNLRRNKSELAKDLATKSTQRSKRGRGKADVDDAEVDCPSQEDRASLDPGTRVGLFRVLQAILLGVSSHLASTNYAASASLMNEQFTPAALSLILQTHLPAMTTTSGRDRSSSSNSRNAIHPSTTTSCSANEHTSSPHAHEIAGITLWIIKLMQSISSTSVTDNDNDHDQDNTSSNKGNYLQILEPVNSKVFVMDLLSRNSCLTTAAVSGCGEESCSTGSYNQTAYDLVLMLSTLEKQEMLITLVTDAVVSSLNSTLPGNQPTVECKINELGSSSISTDSSMDNTTSRAKRRMSSTQGGLTALYAQGTSTAVTVPLAHAILVLEELLQLPLTNVSKSSCRLRRTSLFAEYFENPRHEWSLSRAFDCLRKVVEFKLCSSNMEQSPPHDCHTTVDEACILRLVQIWFLYVLQKDLSSAAAASSAETVDEKSTSFVTFQTISLIHWMRAVVIPKTGFIDETVPSPSAAAAAVTAAWSSLASPVPPPKSKLRLRSPISLSAPMSDSRDKMPTADTLLVPLAISVLKIGLAAFSDCLPSFGRLLRLDGLTSGVRAECTSLLKNCINMIESLFSNGAAFPSSIVPVMVRLCKSMFTTDVIVRKGGAAMPWPLLLELLLRHYLQYAYDENEGSESRKVRELLSSIIRTSGMLKLSDHQHTAIDCCLRLMLQCRPDESDDTNTQVGKEQKTKDFLQCLSRIAPVQTAIRIQKLVHSRLLEANFSDNAYSTDALQVAPIHYLVEILVGLLLIRRDNVSEPLRKIVNLIQNELSTFLSSTTTTAAASISDNNESESRSNRGEIILSRCSYEECFTASEFLKLYYNR